MKILVVSQYFWPESFRINDLVLGLRDRGHDVEVLTGMPNYPGGSLFAGYGWLSPNREIFEGLNIIRVPLVTRGRSKSLRLAANYLSFAASACLLGPLRCRNRYDAVIIYEPSPITVGLPGLLMARLSNAPALLWIQDLWPDTLEAMGFRHGNLIARSARWLSDFIHRRCDRLLVQSRGFVPRLKSRHIESCRIAYLPNWAEAFYQPCDRSLTPLPPDLVGLSGFRIIFAGNIGSAQAFDTIIEAAIRSRNIPNLHWIILGDGLMRDRVAAQILEHRLEGCFHLLGQKPAQDMPAYFAHADVLLATLRADPVFSLTIPSKVQSYLACGRPLVGSIDGEGATVIRDSGAGIVCPAEDGMALADAVMELYRMTPEKRAELGARGRRYYEEHFERSRLLDRLEGWMHELTGRQHAHTDTRR